MHGLTQDGLTLGLCDPTPVQFLEGSCNLFQKNVKDLRTTVMVTALRPRPLS